MIKAFSINTATGICGVIACVAWVVIAISSVIMMRSTWRLYRSRGGDLKKNSAAFRSDVASNIATGRMVL